MNAIINPRLLLHPANWLVVWAVLGFGAMAWGLIHRRLADPAAGLPVGPGSLEPVDTLNDGPLQ